MVSAALMLIAPRPMLSPTVWSFEDVPTVGSLRTGARAPDLMQLGCRRRFLAEDDQAVQDVYAEREDGQRPPRVRPADR